MRPRPVSQLDVPDLLERWRDVARSSVLQMAFAPPAHRAAWERARERAEAVVAALQAAAVAEREANQAWREARAAERRSPPLLWLVE